MRWCAPSTPIAARLIVISHDRSLVEATADRLWVIADGAVKPFDGDMDDYRRYVLRGEPPKPANDVKPAKAAKPAQKPKPTVRPSKNRIAQLEGTMEKANEAIAKIDALIAAAASKRDAKRIASLSEKRSEFERRLVKVEEEWMTLSEALEAS